jgi:hypothetical protein
MTNYELKRYAFSFVIRNSSFVICDEQPEIKNIHNMVLDRLCSEYGILGDRFRFGQPGVREGQAAALLHAEVVQR